MSPKPSVSAERTKQILEAASDVFAKKGFYKARMDDIASKANLSKGALYLYFKSKDAIINALLDRLFQHEFRNLVALEDDEGSALEHLLRFTDSITSDLHNYLRLIPVAYEYLGLIFRNKLVQQTFRQHLRTYVNLTVPIIQEGITNGEFRALDPTDVTLALGAIFEGMILLWVYDPDSIDLEKQIHAGIQLLIDGLKA